MTLRAYDPFRAGDYRADALVVEDLADRVREEVLATGRPASRRAKGNLTRHWRRMMRRCGEYACEDWMALAHTAMAHRDDRNHERDQRARKEDAP